MASHSEATGYLAQLNEDIRGIASSAHEVFVEQGCESYVKTIYIGYDVGGEMVAALYGHADHVEIALALPEDAENSLLVDASHLTWRTLPVAAVDVWMSRGEIADGALFRPVDRHGNVSSTRLSGQSVSLILRRAAENAGIEQSRLSGHSLRAGFATTAAANGASEASIARQTGHTSMATLRRYVRHGTVFIDNAATKVGL